MSTEHQQQQQRTPTKQRRREHSHSHSHSHRNEQVDDFELFKQQAYCSAAAQSVQSSSVSGSPAYRKQPESLAVSSGATGRHSLHGSTERGRMGALRNDSSFSHSIDVGGSEICHGVLDDKEFGGRRAYSVKTASASASHSLKPGSSRLAHDEHRSPHKHSLNNSGSSLAVPETDAVQRSPSRECVRNFQSTSKGVVNKGDSFRSDGSSPRDSNPALNVASPEVALGSTEEALMPPKASQILGCAPSIFYVQMLGAAAVGKSSLCQQFLTSDYMGNIDPDEWNTSVPDLSVAGDCQKHVCVKLDGEESIVVLIDTACNEEHGQEVFGCIDAYLLVFAMDDRESYNYASNLLADLVTDRRTDIPFVLVCNKSDLVRRCDVDADEGRELANRYGCYFIETSASLNHHVDELLVNLLKIVRARHSAKKIKKNDSTKKVTGFLKRLSIRARSKK